MKKLEKVVVNVARKVTEINVCKATCIFFFNQPKVTEELRKRLREKR